MTRTPAEIRHEFHCLLGRLVHAHARFDFNVGLHLKYLGGYYTVPVDDHLHPNIPLDKRLKRLRKIVLAALEKADDEARLEIEGWFRKALENKNLRNDYVVAPAKFI
jgi:hypothetical protein